MVHLKRFAYRTASKIFDGCVILLVLVGIVLLTMCSEGCARKAPPPYVPQHAAPTKPHANAPQAARDRFAEAMKECDRMRGQEAIDCADRAIDELDAER